MDLRLMKSELPLDPATTPRGRDLTGVSFFGRVDNALQIPYPLCILMRNTKEGPDQYPARDVGQKL